MKKQVLLIEPDALLAATYMSALQHAGFKPQWVATATDAIMAADASAPAVIVMELQLTEHDGIEFLHELRSYSEWQRIPVIINSFVRPNVLDKLGRSLREQYGIVACLYKPRTTLKELLRTVRTVTASGYRPSV